MQGRKLARWMVGFVLSCALIGNGLAQTAPKYLRLRNALISTSTPDRTASRAKVAVAEERVSGLYLVQFEGPVQGAWRQNLQELGVQFIRFIPDDAFLVRFQGADLGQVRARPYVRWVGAYGSELKMATELTRMVSGSKGAAERLAVSVLVGPQSTPADVDEVRHLFAQIQGESLSSLGTVLQGAATPSQVTALARSDLVLWIERAPQMRLNDEISSKIVGGTGPIAPVDSGDRSHQVQGLRLDWLGSLDPSHATATQRLGYDGRGVSVAVADSGLENGDAETMHPDLVGRVDGFFYYGSLGSAADENGHGTHIAGIIAGDAATGETDNAGTLYGLGLAPKAHIVVQRVFDAEGQEQMPDYEVLTHDAVRAGAAVESNSWGDDVQGRYDLSAAQFDALVRDADATTPGDQPLVLVFSAGNAGPGRQTVDSPGVAKDVIAVGASENDRPQFGLYTEGQEYMADFSSRGPCEDGRTKPDLVAPGTWIASLQSALADSANAWAPISANYQYEGGTSQAVPHVSGAAAVFIQYYRATHDGTNPSPALVKAALINSATPLHPVGAVAVPNGDEGWGRVTLTNLIGSNRSCQFIDQNELLSTGQFSERRVVVGSGSLPLNFTLVYTDPPGLPAALPALVNDLDLEVVGPDGTLYRGNEFLNGESAPNPVAQDNLNNVESVHLSQPRAGSYLVRVRARNVVEDIHHPDQPTAQQDFALVVSGDLPAPGVGVVVLDRPAYTAPGIIQLQLIDRDLASQYSANVQVSTSRSPNAQSVVLQASGSSGVFTGAVATVTGPASPGQLSIAEGDLIQVSYQDASPAGVRNATAQADLVAPVISGLVATNRFGREVISWQTDKPSDSALYYGTNQAALICLTNQALLTDHQAVVEDLAPGTIYFFYVQSTDTAGNVGSSRSGTNYSAFVGSPTPSVLLVNAYLPDDPAAGTMPIPLTVYTEPLDQSSFSYEVWDLTQPDSVSPSAADLSGFRAVIWRLSDSYASQATLTPEQQAALTSYVSGGGSLFLSSMEILSRIGSVPFRTNILQVESFLTNSAHPLAQCATCDEDHGVTNVIGPEHDPITGAIHATLNFTNYDSPVLDTVGIPANMADTFGPAAGAAPLFYDADSGKVTGIRYPKPGQDSAGRVVFLSFPFDTLPQAVRGPLLKSILTFLAPESASLASISFDRSAYSLPDLATVEVDDAAQAGRGEIKAHAATSSTPAGLDISLTETVRLGVFRGFVTLIPSSGQADPGRIVAHPGDQVWIEYRSAGGNPEARAEADIDVNAPEIKGVASQASFEEATVSWVTSEVSDSLVKFGESTFLGRTAYAADFSNSHELRLAGLQPDRIYYFQVVSRDRAGNTTVDDNQGKLYTFRTKTPAFPPYFDALDGGGNTNWTVRASQGSDAVWALGVPRNGRETQAHSPPDAWGSNLAGQPIALADTTLLSPPIALPAGSYATLRFWESYDFGTDLSAEDGQLLILTNAAESSPTVLDQVSGASTNWQEAVYDLSPFAGHVVQIGWHYEFASAGDPIARPGWLIDDVSVGVTNTVSGQIIITNNLAQAAFSVEGPVSRSGQGWSTILSNMPPGRYTVQFADIPYYNTPAPRAAVLSQGTLLFQGNYTFDDANHNGLPDAWETQFFGGNAPSPANATDSDQDGMSDYAEFVAGTNPLDPTSRLELAPPVRLPNGLCRLSWTAEPGHAYRLLSSPDAHTWTPFTKWIRAGGSQLSYTLTGNAAQTSYFQIEVSP